MKWTKSGRWYEIYMANNWYGIWHGNDGTYFLYFGTADSQQEVRTLEEAKAIVEAMYVLQELG